MNEREFYDYIQEKFNLDGTASRLVYNIIDFVKDGDYDDADSAHRELWHLLGGAFGLEEHEVELYRSDELEKPTLRETLAKNAAKSKALFGNTPQNPERAEVMR